MKDMNLIQVFKDTLEKTKAVNVTVTKYKSQTFPNNIEIINQNCIDTVINTRQQYPKSKIGLLNFADGTERGGGVADGLRTQEEDICRTTSLYHTLLKVNYPIKSDEIVVSKDVILIKNSSYTDLQSPVNIDYVLTKDAVISYDGKFTKAMYEEMERRIELIINTAYSLKVDILILGAFGCGAFRNPPQDIAYLFKKSINRQPYKSQFKEVVFAILEKGDTLNSIFKQTLL